MSSISAMGILRQHFHLFRHEEDSSSLQAGFIVVQYVHPVPQLQGCEAISRRLRRAAGFE